MTSMGEVAPPAFQKEVLIVSVRCVPTGYEANSIAIVSFVFCALARLQRAEAATNSQHAFRSPVLPRAKPLQGPGRRITQNCRAGKRDRSVPLRNQKSALRMRIRIRRDTVVLPHRLADLINSLGPLLARGPLPEQCKSLSTYLAVKVCIDFGTFAQDLHLSVLTAAGIDPCNENYISQPEIWMNIHPLRQKTRRSGQTRIPQWRGIPVVTGPAHRSARLTAAGETGYAHRQMARHLQWLAAWETLTNELAFHRCTSA